jgi:hypothetical protein
VASDCALRARTAVSDLPGRRRAEVSRLGGVVHRGRQKGASEFALLTPVRARPVLVITEVLPEHDEVLALRLRRLEMLATEAERERVREGSDPGLFHLKPDRFRGLSVENAAIVSSLLRLPAAALDRRSSLGALDDNELRALHERVTRVHRLRLDKLVLERAQSLLQRAQRKR